MKKFKKIRPITMTIYVFLAFAGASRVYASSYTPISECGTVINAPGKYRVVQNLDCSGEPSPQAIRIVGTSDVELRLNGYQIKGTFNQTYGGQGVGILVAQSSDIKIEGRNSSTRILNFANAIRVHESNRVEVDGSRMQLNDNTTAILVMLSHEVEIEKLRFKDNRQRDLQIHDSNDVEAKNLDHYGPAPQGILVSDSQQVEIRDANIGQQGKVNRAVIFYNSSDSTLRQSRIDQADVGVLFQGAASHTNTLRHNRLGRDVANICDIQLLFGAEAPVQIGGSPSNLTTCP